MIPNLSQAKSELVDLVAELMDDSAFLSVLSHPDVDSKVISGMLYWNLGFSQGYVVIDVESKQVYRVFYLSDVLSPNSLCDPSTAQIVLDDIVCIVDILTEVLEKTVGQDITIFLAQDPLFGSEKIM